MTTILLRPEATVTIDTEDIDIVGGNTRLSSTNVPYATATLELPLLPDEQIEWLDPRDGVRVPYVAGDTEGATRTFDLGLQSRRVDHRAKSVTLTLASDEALLMRYLPVIEEIGARENETSVRAICNYVLGKIGAELEPGTADADVSAAWELTNLVTNPHADTTTGYIPGVNAGSVTVGTASPWEGTGYVRWVAPAAGNSFLAVPVSDTRVEEGERFEFHAVMRASSSGQQGRAYIQYKDSEGAVLTTISPAGPLVSLATGTGWTEVGVSATIPAGVAVAQPYVVGVGAAGITYAVDAPYFYEGNEYVDFWTGDSDDDTYDYEWAGVPNESPSVRKPVIERLPEMFLWPPGTSAWDFLAPITTVAGLVLWCDEQRRWHLASPEDRTIVSLVTVVVENTRDGTDEISLDDDFTTPTGVIVKYTWRDSKGNSREAFDAAGTPERAIRIDLDDRAYPGPGTAAAILARRQGSGRRQDVTVIAQINTTPGMSAQITLPGAPDTIGRVADVTFDHRTGFMDLDAAGLIDIIPGSVAALTGTADALPGTADSL